MSAYDRPGLGPRHAATVPEKIRATSRALDAASREQVAAFHRAALDAGGRDNGAPGPRPSYGAAYVAAFAYDPDGHNVEAVVGGVG